MANPRAAQTAKNTTGYRATNTVRPAAPAAAPAAPSAPAAPTVGMAPQQPAAPQPSAPDPYSFVDPILQQIQALSTKSRADALSSALSARKQVAIALGDANGVIDDTNTAEAAKQNPFSELALLDRNYGDTTHQHEESLNQNNLWYSGAHAKQLGDDAFNYQQQTAQARGGAQTALGTINTNLASALYNADQQDIAGQQDAYGRALQRNLSYGIDPGTGTTMNPTPQVATAASPPPGAESGDWQPSGVPRPVSVAAALARPISAYNRKTVANLH